VREDEALVPTGKGPLIWSVSGKGVQHEDDAQGRVLTSGGDAPGMNAAIRSVVRGAVSRGWRVLGVKRGYKGLIEGEVEELGARSVSNIIQRGGTMLKTARSEEFLTRAGREKARDTLERQGIDGLVLIGGDGTFRGAIELGAIWPGQLVGVPGTIDNDLFGTD
jgi:6-phosphofructokinase 1